jgi:hypothetical protein
MVNNNVTMAYPNTGATDQFPFSKDFYLILDMQLGGSWVGSVTGSNLPVEMSLDWVRFYKKHETGGKLYVKTLENKIISSGESVQENTVLLVTAMPVEGYVVESVKVNGVDVTAQHNISGTYAFMPTEATTISATYKQESSSIDDVRETTDATVYAMNKKIVIVTSEPTEATIFNLSGMVVDKRVVEGRVEIEKPSGVYIVKVGSKVYKVRL